MSELSVDERQRLLAFLAERAGAAAVIGTAVPLDAEIVRLVAQQLATQLGPRPNEEPEGVLNQADVGAGRTTSKPAGTSPENDVAEPIASTSRIAHPFGDQASADKVGMPAGAEGEASPQVSAAASSEDEKADNVAAASHAPQDQSEHAESPRESSASAAEVAAQDHPVPPTDSPQGGPATGRSTEALPNEPSHVAARSESADSAPTVHDPNLTAIAEHPVTLGGEATDAPVDAPHNPITESGLGAAGTSDAEVHDSDMQVETAQEQMDALIEDLGLPAEQVTNVEEAVSSVQQALDLDPELREIIAGLSESELSDALDAALADAGS